MKTLLLSTHDYVVGDIILVKRFKMSWCVSTVTQLTDHLFFCYHTCIIDGAAVGGKWPWSDVHMHLI